MCIYRILIPSSMNGHLGCFQFLAFINNAAVNTGVRISLRIHIFVFFGGKGIARLCGSSILHFLGNVHTALHSGYTNLHPVGSCVKPTQAQRTFDFKGLFETKVTVYSKGKSQLVSSEPAGEKRHVCTAYEHHFGIDSRLPS